MAGMAPAFQRAPPMCAPDLRLPEYTLSPSEAARALETNETAGLTTVEAAARLGRTGPNRIWRPDRPDFVRIAARQLLDPLVALLIAAVVVSASIGEGLEAVVIGAIVVLNAVLGFVQEAGAERAVLALRESIAEHAGVVRDGRKREIDAEEIVPGDLVVLREGDRVPADARIVSSHRLEVDESALTGESLPVDKSALAVPPETPLAERVSMVYAGTSITRGRGAALVTATAGRTELGQITLLAAEAKPPPTPLQRRLRGLARVMVLAGAVSRRRSQPACCSAGPTSTRPSSSGWPSPWRPCPKACRRQSRWPSLSERGRWPERGRSSGASTRSRPSARRRSSAPTRPER